MTYLAGNRSFSTITAAEKYCIENDFDPDIITEQKEDQEEQIFWYELIYRGVSPGCQPMDFICIDYSRGKWGIVGYNRQLTEKELNEYELKPWKE